MSKPSKYFECVHCLKRLEKLTLTWDHVFPKSWYPDTTPMNLEKWKIPSCSACNAKYGKIENDLLLRLGLCISNEEAKTAGISEKALRSIQPLKAKSDRDCRIRGKKLQQIHQELIHLEYLPKEGLLPNFGPEVNQQSGPYLRVLISKTKLEALAVKIIRGITYLATGKTLSNEFNIPIIFGDEEKAFPVIQFLQNYGKIYECGPGIVVHRAEASEDNLIAVYRIEIWGKLRIYGATWIKSAPFPPKSGNIANKVIDQNGDEVLKMREI